MYYPQRRATLPIAILPLLAGLLLNTWSYPTIFGIVAVFVLAGAFWTRRLPDAVYS